MIEVRNLSKRFGDKKVVNEISIKVEKGEIYGLVGPDGAGKTTTIRLICAALKPEKSVADQTPSIFVAGYDMFRDTEQARAEIGYLPQRFSLYEDLTVFENIRFFAEVRGLARTVWQPRCLEILKFVGLDAFAERRAGYLSGGMKQKLGLAAALVHRPSVLLLDEPTSGVDPVTRQDFWRLMIRLVSGSTLTKEDDAKGVSVLMSTPYMDEASRCTRVGFMKDGRLLLEGTPDELRKKMKGSVLELHGEPLDLLRRLVKEDEAVEDAQMFGDRLHLRIEEVESQMVISRLERRIESEGGQVFRFRQIPAQLEDVFISLHQG